ncbi:MAG TPA: CopG family antitoxin [Oligoflexia bacterium]|mgnify:CR=1 FL=1|nr:CopG family antitoxin [Oligoflexia bacterium]
MVAENVKEEKELIESYDRGEWKSSRLAPGKAAEYKEAARRNLAKDKRINIRISSEVLDELRVIAADEGIPYQTLIASVLHKYAHGRFIEAGRKTKPGVHMPAKRRGKG